jgi:hypothetical protein
VIRVNDESLWLPQVGNSHMYVGLQSYFSDRLIVSYLLTPSTSWHILLIVGACEAASELAASFVYLNWVPCRPFLVPTLVPFHSPSSWRQSVYVIASQLLRKCMACNLKYCVYRLMSLDVCAYLSHLRYRLRYVIPI